jgi:hypothetical protein
MSDTLKPASLVAPTDISVVVQGPLARGKQEGIEVCLDSLRRVLPGAQVIVSTWDSEDTENLGDDLEVVTSPDPGGWTDFGGYGYNLTRQLVSTQAGMALANRKFILKLRPDLSLIDTSICQDLKPGRDAILPGRLVMTNYFVRDPEKLPMLFHLSDLAMFGCAESMRTLWNCPLPDKAKIWATKPIVKLFTSLYLTHARQAPEQYLVLQLLNQAGHAVDLAHPFQASKAKLDLWSITLANNFKLLDAETSGVVFPDRFRSAPLNKATLLTAERFERLAYEPFSYLITLNALYNPFQGPFLHKTYGFIEKALFLMGPEISKVIRPLLKSAKKAVRRILGRTPQQPGKY